MDQSPLAIHHVGVAVPSIDDAMHFYGDKLGLSLVDTLELPDRQLKVAFVQSSQYADRAPGADGPELDRLALPGAARAGAAPPVLRHPDIRRHLKDLQDKGVELIDEAPRPGAHGEVAFLQPSAGLGVLVELFQATDATLAPASAEPPPTDESASPTTASAEARVESSTPTPTAPSVETTGPAPERSGPRPTTEMPGPAEPPTPGSSSSAPTTGQRQLGAVVSYRQLAAVHRQRRLGGVDG